MKYDSCPLSFVRSACLATFVFGGSFGQTPPAPKIVSAPPKAPQTAQTPKPSPTPATAAELITQGNLLYRKSKFDLAIKQFLAALKLEPNNDQALGYASITAYQLGNQVQARDLFQRRADLPQQKDSVNVFCNYMVAMTWWWQSHELIAKYGELKFSKTVYTLPDKDQAVARQCITAGLASIAKVVTLKADYTEAVNLRNLLHAEAALLAPEESKAESERKAALDSLRQAIKLAKSTNEDFGAPTLLIGEFALKDEEQSQIQDPMLMLVEGGRPLTRVTAVLPTIKIAAAKPKGTGDQPPPTGVGAGGSAVSIGPGQGALRPSKTETIQLKGGKVKVEVLISRLGKVVFTRILDGPPATTGPALEAAKKWTFSPPKFEGTPIQVLGVITFDIKSVGADKLKAKASSATKSNSDDKKKPK